MAPDVKRAQPYAVLNVPRETLVSIVAPIGEGTTAAVESFVRETADVLRPLVAHYEIILVDDGLAEAEARALRDVTRRTEFVRLLSLSRRFGQETAIAAGLDAAIGDHVIVMLPEHDPPGLLPRFLEQAGTWDIVYGVREHRRGEPWWYRLGTSVFYWYMNRVLDAGLPTDTTQFRCMSRQVVNAITSIRDPDRYLRLLTSYVGFRKAPLPYSPLNRTGTPPIRRSTEAFGLARTLILDHSVQPLRFAGLAAVLAAFVNVLTALVGLTPFDAEAYSRVPLAIALFALALALWVTGEYIGHLLRRARTRPSYYIREEETSEILLREERRNVVDNTVDR